MRLDEVEDANVRGWGQIIAFRHPRAAQLNIRLIKAMGVAGFGSKLHTEKWFAPAWHRKQQQRSSQIAATLMPKQAL